MQKEFHSYLLSFLRNCSAKLQRNVKEIQKKQHKKGHNAVILKNKNAKKLHNMHMVITHLNPKLWIRTYNGFAVIPDLRQTGISENLATFGQK